MALSIILVVLITVCLLWAWPSPAFVYEFWKAIALSVLFGLAITAVIYTITHIKFARDLHDVPFWKRFHIAPPRFKYDDESLGYAVGFARQALSIDESRASFDRVRWGEMGHAAQLVQMWFAGNHSDIGGSYPEEESPPL